MDSLSPFQVPRRSGMAESAAAGTAASATNVTIQANFDTTGSLPGGARSLYIEVDSIERGAASDVVGIWRGAISGQMKVLFQAARSIG